MREKEDYRENLMRIDNQYPDGELLNKSQVATYLGVDRKTVDRMFQKEFINNYISKTKLARLIS